MTLRMHELKYRVVPCSSEAHLGHTGDLKGDELNQNGRWRSQGHSVERMQSLAFRRQNLLLGRWGRKVDLEV